MDFIEECKRAWNLKNWKRFVRAVQNESNKNYAQIAALRLASAETEKELLLTYPEIRESRDGWRAIADQKVAEVLSLTAQLAGLVEALERIAGKRFAHLKSGSTEPRFVHKCEAVDIAKAALASLQGKEGGGA